MSSIWNIGCFRRQPDFTAVCTVCADEGIEKTFRCKNWTTSSLLYHLRSHPDFYNLYKQDESPAKSNKRVSSNSKNSELDSKINFEPDANDEADGSFQTTVDITPPQKRISLQNSMIDSHSPCSISSTAKRNRTDKDSNSNNFTVSSLTLPLGSDENNSRDVRPLNPYEPRNSAEPELKSFTILNAITPSVPSNRFKFKYPSNANATAAVQIQKPINIAEILSSSTPKSKRNMSLLNRAAKRMQMPCPIAPIGLSIKHSGTKMAGNNGAAASSQEFTPLLISKILERLNRDSDDEALFGQYIANFLRRLQTQKEKSNFRIELENLMQKYQAADEH